MNPARPACALVAAAAVSLASVDVHADSPILESYIGKRPDDASSLVAPMVAELEVGGSVSGAKIGELYESLESRPGVAVDKATLDGFLGKAQSCYDSYAKAKKKAEFLAVVEACVPLVEIGKDASAAMASDSDIRDAFLVVLVSLALAHKRLRQSDQAEGAMAELIRSFRDQAQLGAYLEAEYGREARRLHDNVAKVLQAQATATITVSIDNPDAIVFANEVYEAGSGEIEIKNLLPGTYRLLVRKGQHSGRVYEVAVGAGDTATVRVTWECDEALHTSPDWVGFLWRDRQTRDAWEGTCSMRFARTLKGDRATVVGVDEHSRRRLRGIVYTVDGIDSAMDFGIRLEPVIPSKAQRAALGAWLDGRIPSPPSEEPIPEVEVAAPPAAAPGQGTPRRLLVGAGLGGGLLVAGVGAGLLAADGTPTCDVPDATCPREYATGTSGIIVAGVGAAAILASTAYWYLGARRAGGVGGVDSREPLAAMLVGAGAVLVATGAIVYAFDEDSVQNGERVPSYRDSARLGLAIAAAGLVAGGVGGYFLLRDRGTGGAAATAVVPVIGDDAAGLALAGRF